MSPPQLPYHREFADRIADVRDDATLRSFHRWLYDANPTWAFSQQLNAKLPLKKHPEYEIKPDLPCLTVGSRAGIVVLLANPGWDKNENPPWDAACASAGADGYHDLLINYFDAFPRIVGDVLTNGRRRWYGKFWAPAVTALRLLGKDDIPVDVESRWRYAHETRQFGSWDIFPMMSDKDGISGKRWPELEVIAEASVKALLRFRPKLLLVASAAGSQIVRTILGTWPTRVWTHCQGPEVRVGGGIRAVCCYRSVLRHEDTSETEVITAGTQVFSGQGAIYLNPAQLFDDVVPQLRKETDPSASRCPRCAWEPHRDP